MQIYPAEAFRQPRHPHAIFPVTELDYPHLIQNCWPHAAATWIKNIQRREYTIRRNHRGGGWVYRHQEQAIAFGHLTIWTHAAEISDLIVTESQRGQGIGTMLIQSLCQESLQYPIDFIEIGVDQTNTRALALYQRLGFDIYREISYPQHDASPNGPQHIFYLRIDL
ncbi:hypothetical protein MASR2M15_22110 [Anaerolineales bacterium]